MEKILEMFHLVHGGSEVVRDGQFPGNFNSRTTSGASQRHIHMPPVKWHSEKGDSVVSDGKLPGNFQMGEGVAYGVDRKSVV